MAAVSAIIPVMKLVIDPFTNEDIAQILVIFAKGIFFSDREHNVHIADVIERFRIVEIGQKMSRGMKVNIFAVVTSKEIFKSLDLYRQIISP